MISSATTTPPTCLFTAVGGRATTSRAGPGAVVAVLTWRPRISRSTARSLVPSVRTRVNGWSASVPDELVARHLAEHWRNWLPLWPGVSSTICPVRRNIAAAR